MSTHSTTALGPVNFDALERQGKEHLYTGVGLGVASLGAAALLGAACPLCVVAVPALIGSGFLKRSKAKRAREAAESTAPLTPQGAEDGSLA